MNEKLEYKNCGIINLNDLNIEYLNIIINKYTSLIIILPEEKELLISIKNIHEIEK